MFSPFQILSKVKKSRMITNYKIKKQQFKGIDLKF